MEGYSNPVCVCVCVLQLDFNDYKISLSKQDVKGQNYRDFV